MDDDKKIYELEHDNSGSDESFTENDPVPDYKRDMDAMHIEEELDGGSVIVDDEIDPEEEEELEEEGYGVQETDERPIVDEGYGLSDDEPSGTAEYDSDDEWN